MSSDRYLTDFNMSQSCRLTLVEHELCNCLAHLDHLKLANAACYVDHALSIVRDEARKMIFPER